MAKRNPQPPAKGDITVHDGTSDVRLAIGADGLVLTADSAETTGVKWAAVASGGSGDVVGPASATDNALVRFDSTTGKLVQGSTAILDDSGNLDLSGNLTLTGTVDGRSVSTDGTKLDGIEANADVTDAANVAAAGAVMDGHFTAKGDILTATGASAPTIIPVGTDGSYLKADSSTATGLTWTGAAVVTTATTQDYSDVAVVGADTVNIFGWASQAQRLTKVEVYSTTPASVGTYTFSLTKNPNGTSANMLSAATFDMTTLTASTLTDVPISATTGDITLATGDQWEASFVSSDAAIDATGVYFVLTWEVDTSADALPTTTKGDLVVYDGSLNRRLAVGTDGQSLVADSSTTTGVAYATPFSAGVSKTLSPPQSATWSTSLGTPSVTDASRFLHIKRTGTGTFANEGVALARSAGQDLVVAFRQRSVAVDAGNASVSVGIRDSGTGNMTTITVRSGDDSRIHVYDWTSLTHTTPTEQALRYGATHAQPILWVKIEDDGVNLSFHVASDTDGDDWVSLYSVALGSAHPATPNQWVLLAGDTSSGSVSAMEVLHVEVI